MKVTTPPAPVGQGLTRVHVTNGSKLPRCIKLSVPRVRPDAGRRTVRLAIDPAGSTLDLAPDVLAALREFLERPMQAMAGLGIAPEPEAEGRAA